MNTPMAPWEQAWRGIFGLPDTVPQWVPASLAILVILLMIVMPASGMLAYLERKLGADFQARVGPNRSGPAGIFQPIADLIKLLQKANFEPMDRRERRWLAVHTMALYSTVAVLPLGSAFVLVDTDMSGFFPLWAALVFALGTMLLGFSQGSVPGWFGGIRVASQALAGAFPALIAFLCAGVRSASFRWSDLAGAQTGSILSWTALSNPFEFVAFVVFLISGMVMLGVPPLDAAFSSVELSGGVSSHLPGRRLSLFRLARFYAFFLWSVITVAVFLGAWNLPFGLSEWLKDQQFSGILLLLELMWVLIKVFTLMLTLVWVARVNPRSRIDQVTDFSWKVLSPFSLVALIGAGLWAGWRALL